MTLQHFGIAAARKQQRHIHADTGLQQAPSSLDTRAGAGNLDHQVRAIHALLEVQALRHHSLDAVARMQRDLQRHIAVNSFGRGVQRLQHIARIANVAHGEVLVQLEGTRQRVLGAQRCDRRPVLGTFLERLLKDARVRGHTANAIRHQLLEAAAIDQRARNRVVPEGLT